MPMSILAKALTLSVAAIVPPAIAWGLAAGTTGQESAPIRIAGRHLAVNTGGDYQALRAIGFDLVDVGSTGALDALPDGMRGVLWLGNGFNKDCRWRLGDAEVVAAVAVARGHPAFSGVYYISDEPHPAACPGAAAAIAARSDLIRLYHPGALTFVVIQGGSNGPDEFAQLGAVADLIGIDPYPCNEANSAKGCDLEAMRQRIEAAMDAGIPIQRIVPIFQTFGQSCTDRDKKYYRLPTEAEAKAMLKLWDELVPQTWRSFDMAYSWAPQPSTSCPTLKMADGTDHPNLQKVFQSYFAQGPGATEPAQEQPK